MAGLANRHRGTGIPLRVSPPRPAIEEGAPVVHDGQKKTALRRLSASMFQSPNRVPLLNGTHAFWHRWLVLARWDRIMPHPHLRTGQASGFPAVLVVRV